MDKVALWQARSGEERRAGACQDNVRVMHTDDAHAGTSGNYSTSTSMYSYIQ